MSVFGGMKCCDLTENDWNDGECTEKSFAFLHDHILSYTTEDWLVVLTVTLTMLTIKTKWDNDPHSALPPAQRG